MEVAGTITFSVSTGMQCPLTLCLDDSGPGLKRWAGDWRAQQSLASSSVRHKSGPSESTIVRTLSVNLILVIYEYTTFLDGGSLINVC